MAEDRWIAYVTDGTMHVKRYKPDGAVDAYVQGAERIYGPYSAHDRQKAVEIASEKLAKSEPDQR